MKKFLDVLNGCPLFYSIKEEYLPVLLGCLGARILHFDKKQTIMAEGTPAKNIGIVLSGHAQITRIDHNGNRNILSEAAVGEVFAEAFACAGAQPLPIAVVADEPCEVMIIECYRVLQPCSKGCNFHKQLTLNLIKDLATKTISFHQRIEITSKRTTRDKLMTYLALQAKKAGSYSFDIPFDRQALADFLEVDRSGLSTEIGRLCREGVIKSRKNHFELLGEVV